MSEIVYTNSLYSMYRRWAYMVIAILASWFLMTKPVFNFQEDKGILYIRSFSMTQTEFSVTQTDLSNGVPYVTDMMSIKWLYYCNKAMLWGCIACFLCFFSNRWRMLIALITALIAGSYYLVITYYAIQLSDTYYATLYPNLMVVLPAIVCQMMIMVRHNIIRAGIDEDERERSAEV